MGGLKRIKRQKEDRVRKALGVDISLWGWGGPELKRGWPVAEWAGERVDLKIDLFMWWSQLQGQGREGQSRRFGHREMQGPRSRGRGLGCRFKAAQILMGFFKVLHISCSLSGPTVTWSPAREAAPGQEHEPLGQNPLPLPGGPSLRASAETHTGVGQLYLE